LYLIAEAMFEMLMRDYSYHIYRSLYSCLEVTESNVEVTTTDPIHTVDESSETIVKSNEDNQESMVTNVDEQVNLPGLDLTNDEKEQDDDNGKKRKRTPSKVMRIETQ
jgi:hypothetical protein